MPDPTQEIHVDEVLPPQVNPIAAKLAGSKDPVDNAAARILTKYLDELMRVPGTNVRFGLDPILALIPAVGDTVASGAGFIILLDALRSGIPIHVFLRMAVNMGVNFIIGLVPGAGALASVFFKSNSRNLKLLTEWQAGNQDKVHRSTLHYFLGLMLLFGMIVGFIVVGWMVYAWLLVTLFNGVMHGLGLK